MKLRCWLAMLLAMGLLCGCVGAETTGVRGHSINSGMKIAMVNGEVSIKPASMSEVNLVTGESIILELN